jgi:hypothetical protein
MIKSPFKFLDAYSLADRDIFFGRDQEKTERRAWGMEHGATGDRLPIAIGTATGKWKSIGLRE